MSDDSELVRSAQARVGRVLRGKYRLDSVLGIGGMAVVYSATHRNQAEFAIKILHPELSIREDVRTRFLREGYAANSVKHPGVVQVVDDDVAEDGAAFLVMELLRGLSVETLWERNGGRLPPPGAAILVGQLLDVLAAAHDKAIIHRDIKPANLFVLPDGTLKVLDFGIARARDAAMDGDGKGTGTGMLLGTPSYMAPEQAMAKSSLIDAQTDVWAAAATFFTLVSGELVHLGENATQHLIMAATTPARSLLSVAPQVPPGIAQVIDAGLAFDKANRWRSALAMRDALRDAACAAYGPLPERVPLAALTADRVSAYAATQGVPMVTPLPPSPPISLGPHTPMPSGPGASVPSGPGLARLGGQSSQAWGYAGTAAQSQAAAEPVVIAKHSPVVPLLVIGGVLSVIAVAGLLGSRVLGGSSSSAGAAANASTATLAPSAPTAAPSAAATQAAPPTAPVVDAAPEASPATAHPRPTPSASPSPPPIPPVAPPVPAKPAASAPAVSCTPPYYFDRDGNRVFKRECL